MNDWENDGSWRKSMHSIFRDIDIRDCTPETVLETMRWMERLSNRLEDITIAARTRNITANDENVLECLRELYKDGKIQHREIAGRHFFIYPSK